MRIAWWLLIAAALGFESVDAAPQWHALPGAPTEGRYDGLHFIDADTGWVCNGAGRILRTTDGGVSWELQHDVGVYLRCIGFADGQRGWAGALFSEAILFHTTNGGVSWTEVTNIPEPRPNALCGISIPTGQVIYCVGSYASPARVIKSTDGGATWTSMDLAPLATTLVDVYFKNASEGLAVGSIGTWPTETRAVVLHTTDGGATWQQRFVGSRFGEWCWKISFPTSSVGYVSLERDAGPMFVLKTVDGGLTWSELPFPNYNEQGIGFVSPSTGWVGGGLNPTHGTTDGGASWVQTPWGESVNRFQFLSPTLGYASGSTVYKYSGSLVAVGDASKPSLKPVAAPNPFGSGTSIRFTLRQAGRVRLFIVDPSGRVVRALEDGARGAGPHVVTWDGKDDGGGSVPAGIYLYVLHAGEQHDMGKVARVPRAGGATAAR